MAISLTNNVSAVLQVIQRDLFGLHKTVDLTTAKFDRMKVAMVGAMAATSGIVMLKGFEGLADAGGRLINQQQLMIANGTTQADLAKEMATAYGMASISGSELTQNLKMVADLRQVFGQQNLGEAMQLAPSLMKSGIAAGLMSGKDPEKEGYNIAMAAERLGYTTNKTTGQIDPQRLTQFGNIVDAIMAATNGRVGTQDILSFSQMASAGGRLLSLQGLMDMVPVIQTFGGFKAGTMLTAFQKAFGGGVMTQRGTTWLEHLGLLNKKAVHNGESGYAQVQTSMLAGYDEMMADPQGWANDILGPALAKAGISKKQMLENLAAGNGIKVHGNLQDELKQILSSGLANTNVRLLADLIANSQINAKEVDNVKTAASTSQYGAEMASLGGATLNFQTAFSGLFETLGLPAAKMAVPILNDISSSLRGLTQFLGNHPAYAKAIDDTLLGLGAALTVLGGIAVVGALASMVGPAGLIAGTAVGIVGLGAALSSIPGAVATAEHAVQRLVYDLLHPGQLIGDLAPGQVQPAGTHKIISEHGTAYVKNAPGAGGKTFGDFAGQINKAQDAFLKGLHDWILAGAPVTVANSVTVANPHAIASAVKTGLAGAASAPQSGTTGFNGRSTPFGSPAYVGAP